MTSSRREVCLAHLAMLYASLAFGALTVIVKECMRKDVSPIVFGVLRDVMACPFLLTLLLIKRSSDSNPRLSTLMGKHPLPGKKEYGLLILCGILGIFALQLTYIIGIQKTTADIAGYYQPLAPLITASSAVVCRLERFRVLTCLGVMTGAVGVLVMVWTSSTHARTSPTNATFVNADHSGRELMVGHVLLIISEFCAAAYILLQKPLFAYWSPLAITTSQYCVGAMCMLVVSSTTWSDPEAWHFKDSEWWAIIYAAVACSGIAYLMMTWANQHIDATLVSLYGVLQPITTALLAFLFLGESLFWQDAIGAILIITGLITTSLPAGDDLGEVETDHAEGLLDAPGCDAGSDALA